MNHHFPTLEVACLSILAVTVELRSPVLLLLRCLKISSSLVAAFFAASRNAPTASFFDTLADFFGIAGRRTQQRKRQTKQSIVMG